MLWTPKKKRLLTRPYQPRYVSLSDIIVRLGLYQGLKLCLDSGSILSAPASPTKWLDMSGGGYDFFRGTTVGADATDPTFNGDPGGLSENEYWSFDGGDYFTYDAANEPWMNNLHRGNALLSYVGLVYYGGSTLGQTFFGTRASSNSNIGFSFQTNGINGNLQYTASNGTGTQAFTVTVGGTAPSANTWHFVGLSLNEAADASIAMSNDAVGLAGAAYTTPSAAAATFTMQIAARGNADTPVVNLTRLGAVAMWEGRALTQAELAGIYEAVRLRYLI